MEDIKGQNGSSFVLYAVLIMPLVLCLMIEETYVVLLVIILQHCILKVALCSRNHWKLPLQT